VKAARSKGGGGGELLQRRGHDEEGEGKKRGRTGEAIRAQASAGNYGYPLEWRNVKVPNPYVKWVQSGPITSPQIIESLRSNRAHLIVAQEIYSKYDEADNARPDVKFHAHCTHVA
jgi:hypothetical protein